MVIAVIVIGAPVCLLCLPMVVESADGTDERRLASLFASRRRSKTPGREREVFAEVTEL